MWNFLVDFGLALLLQEAVPTRTTASTPLPSSQDGGFGSVLWLMLGIGIGIVIGLLLSKAFAKPRTKLAEEVASNLSIYTPPRPLDAATTIAPRAMRCPMCNSTYTDEALIYCVSDGTTLVSADNPRASDPNATMLYRESPK